MITDQMVEDGAKNICAQAGKIGHGHGEWDALGDDAKMVFRLFSLAALTTALGDAVDEINRLRSVLEFYADPFAWKAKHDPENDFQVPDFYSETNFGDIASEALAVTPHDGKATP